MPQTQRSPAPPSNQSYGGSIHHDQILLEFRCQIQHPDGPLLASLRDQYNRETQARPIDALTSPDIAPYLTDRARQTLAMMMLYGDE